MLPYLQLRNAATHAYDVMKKDQTLAQNRQKVAQQHKRLHFSLYFRNDFTQIVKIPFFFHFLQCIFSIDLHYKFNFLQVNIPTFSHCISNSSETLRFYWNSV